MTSISGGMPSGYCCSQRRLATESGRRSIAFSFVVAIAADAGGGHASGGVLDVIEGFSIPARMAGFFRAGMATWRARPSGGVAFAERPSVSRAQRRAALGSRRRPSRRQCAPAAGLGSSPASTEADSRRRTPRKPQLDRLRARRGATAPLQRQQQVRIRLRKPGHDLVGEALAFRHRPPPVAFACAVIQAVAIEIVAVGQLTVGQAR